MITPDRYIAENYLDDLSMYDSSGGSASTVCPLLLNSWIEKGAGEKLNGEIEFWLTQYCFNVITQALLNYDQERHEQWITSVPDFLNIGENGCCCHGSKLPSEFLRILKNERGCGDSDLSRFSRYCMYDYLPDKLPASKPVSLYEKLEADSGCTGSVYFSPVNQ
jgi:hypothetical protein